ncbi:MAG: M13 family metallopeptidase [Cyclobacteriaceae bacterium]|nr:M13 family metallopeptidase [Cyclobacteriaceae bacterium HetDA_MAG_MS6]
MEFKHLIQIAAVALLISCQGLDQGKTEMPPGLDLEQMDLTVDPKVDFYKFANGNWLEKTEIPADEGRWGGFGELADRNNKVVLDVLERAAENTDFKDGSDERKAINFYGIGMDSLLAEKVGVSALENWYQKIDDLKDKSALSQLLADLHVYGYGPFHGSFVLANLSNSDINSFYIGSGGLGLPNREYYTKTDSKSMEIKEKYAGHLANILELSQAGSDYDAMSEAIMSMENELAESTLTPIEQRNIPALNNPMAVEDLIELAPLLDWDTYLSGIGVKEIDTLIVTEPKFLSGMNAVLDRSSLDDIKAYLKWHVVNRAAPYLNNDLVQADFDFFGKVIRGTEEMRPRWERVLGNTNRAVGEALGKVYVAETFPPEAKASAEEMVNNLLQAFEGRINNLSWMSDETKTQALKKLKNLTVKIGYPNKWRDYSNLVVETTGESYNYLSNIENAAKWRFVESVKEIGQSVDKERWAMNPQTVNAYFNPLNNEIVFPAAILQPPFYNYTADPAINYGGMGAVIGHEISHGFDDQGSRFDADGNLVNWWTEEDKTRFEERTKLLVEQFDAYQPLDSVNVQGKLTLGENIGDLGGLNAAYDGLKIHFEKNGKPEPIDGFTQEQRFFISWATIWRTKYRDETLRTQILTDPHSPGMFRAIGPLVNMETFYEAFDIQEGDELWKPEDQRVKIW